MGIITLLGLTWISERLNERALMAMLQAVWTLPCLLALRFWPGALKNVWGTFALITVFLSCPYSHAIVTYVYIQRATLRISLIFVRAWTSKNSGSVRTRTVSAAVYNSKSYNFFRCIIRLIGTNQHLGCAQLDFVIAANIYRTDDAPLYHRGNRNLIIINFVVIGAFIGAKLYYITRNKARSKKWEGMTAEVRLLLQDE